MPCETIESGRCLYLTARLPREIGNFSGVRITPGAVHIQGDCGTATIVPGTSFDTAQSYYGVNTGILNITLKKGLTDKAGTPAP